MLNKLMIIIITLEVERTILERSEGSRIHPRRQCHRHRRVRRVLASREEPQPVEVVVGIGVLADALVAHEVLLPFEQQVSGPIPRIPVPLNLHPTCPGTIKDGLHP